VVARVRLAGRAASKGVLDTFDADGLFAVTLEYDGARKSR
jgi:hypothetical protein